MPAKTVWHREAANKFEEGVRQIHQTGFFLKSEPDRREGTMVSLQAGNLNGLNVDFREDEGIPKAVISHDERKGKRADLLLDHSPYEPEEHTPTWLALKIPD